MCQKHLLIMNILSYHNMQRTPLVLPAGLTTSHSMCVPNLVMRAAVPTNKRMWGAARCASTRSLPRLQGQTSHPRHPRGFSYSDAENPRPFSGVGSGTDRLPWKPLVFTHSDAENPRPFPGAGEGRSESKKSAFRCQKSIVLQTFCPPLNLRGCGSVGASFDRLRASRTGANA